MVDRLKYLWRHQNNYNIYINLPLNCTEILNLIIYLIIYKDDYYFYEKVLLTILDNYLVRSE